MKFLVLSLLLLLSGSYSSINKSISALNQPQNEYGCVMIAERVQEILSSKLKKSQEALIYTCCGGVRLYAKVRVDNKRRKSIIGWNIKDAQDNELGIDEINGADTLSFIGGESENKEIRSLKVILAKGVNNHTVACFIVRAEERKPSQ